MATLVLIISPPLPLLMSFRTEEKISLSTSQSHDIIDNLNDLGMKSLHPKRLISSIYFDTSNLQMLDDSEEGLLPRKKIRIRSYNNSADQNLLEKKISSIEGRFKTSSKIEHQIKKDYFKNGYFDRQYGILFPKVRVEYERNYYKLDNLRVTLDSNIRYCGFKGECFIRETSNVLEFKGSANISQDDLYQYMPSQRRRFSKFANAMNAIYKKY